MTEVQKFIVIKEKKVSEIWSPIELHGPHDFLRAIVSELDHQIAIMKLKGFTSFIAAQNFLKGMLMGEKGVEDGTLRARIV